MPATTSSYSVKVNGASASYDVRLYKLTAPDSIFIAGGGTGCILHQEILAVTSGNFANFNVADAYPLTSGWYGIGTRVAGTGSYTKEAEKWGFWIQGSLPITERIMSVDPVIYKVEEYIDSVEIFIDDSTGDESLIYEVIYCWTDAVRDYELSSGIPQLIATGGTPSTWDTSVIANANQKLQHIATVSSLIKGTANRGGRIIVPKFADQCILGRYMNTAVRAKNASGNYSQDTINETVHTAMTLQSSHESANADLIVGLTQDIVDINGLINPTTIGGSFVTNSIVLSETTNPNMLRVEVELDTLPACAYGIRGYYKTGTGSAPAYIDSSITIGAGTTHSADGYFEIGEGELTPNKLFYSYIHKPVEMDISEWMIVTLYYYSKVTGFIEAYDADHTITASIGAGALKTSKVIYGEISIHDNTTGAAINMTTNYAIVTSFDTVGLQNGCVGTATYGTTAQIVLSEPGIYHVESSISYMGTNQKEYRFVVFLDSVEQDHVHSANKLQNSDVNNAFVSGLLTATAGQIVTLRARTPGTTGTLSIIYANLNIRRLI